jgi:hypothetical protein
MPPLWNDGGDSRVTPQEDWPADTGAYWSGQRYVTREQFDLELTLAGPYSLVVRADDEAVIASAMQYAESVHTYAGGKELMGVFVRSRQPALAALVAERLTAEQGRAHVFVVIERTATGRR